jgi:hypothetical protein
MVKGGGSMAKSPDSYRLVVSTVDDCAELSDRANTAEQELGAVILDMRTFANRLRDSSFPSDDRQLIADAIYEILGGE